jgi:hypothetical protein
MSEFARLLKRNCAIGLLLAKQWTVSVRLSVGFLIRLLVGLRYGDPKGEKYGMAFAGMHFWEGTHTNHQSSVLSVINHQSLYVGRVLRYYLRLIVTCKKCQPKFTAYLRTVKVEAHIELDVFEKREEMKFGKASSSGILVVPNTFLAIERYLKMLCVPVHALCVLNLNIALRTRYIIQQTEVTILQRVCSTAIGRL